jgi:hypothetical protein
VLAHAGRGDWILCHLTSRPYADSAATDDQHMNIVLETADFE